MNIKWERNSRALSLVAQGKIKDEDILPRSRTDEFPTEAATVRIQRLSEKIPNVVVHIRGKSRQMKTSWNNATYECADTCRVNVASPYRDGKVMSSSGELDESLTWLDVHNIVTEVKEAMGI